MFPPKVGDKIGIYYNENDAKINMLANIRNGFRNTFFVYGGIIILLAMILLLFVR